MPKTLSISFLVTFFVVASTSPAMASLIKINSEGEAVIKVLSATDTSEIDIPKPTSLDINKVGNSNSGTEGTISLSKNEDKISLKIQGEDGDKHMDVSGWTEDLIEIEERPEVQRLRVFLEDGKFALKQKGVSAKTDKEILIDSKQRELSVKTETGNKFLAVLPYDAVQTLLKTKVVNEVSQNNLEITEDEGELAYKIEGNKVLNFFNVYSYKIPVSSYVSASSGEILKVESPTIYKYVTFLFV